MKGKDFITITDFTADEVKDVIARGMILKHMSAWGEGPKPLAGKAGALIFHKPSLRTRVSFQVGIAQLGGSSVYLTDAEIGFGKRESIEDIARVLSRYVDFIVIRTFSQEDVEKLGKYSSVPVINALTDLTHPCQVMGDALTIMEKFGYIEGVPITYIGAPNNIANSWLNLASLLPMNLRIATAEGLAPDEEILKRATGAKKSKISILHDPKEAVKGAKVIYTDVWASMHEKQKSEERSKLLASFQVNRTLLASASPDAIVMHCLPAERGREITDEVMDGPHSVVFDQAENRLHVQKAIIMHLMK
ncbi:ornithine carbamoyltransferase [bacterium]|nr:ornithine carbamoyltransferase [bacterium]